MAERNLMLRPFFNLRGFPFFGDEDFKALQNWPELESNYDLSSDDKNVYVKVNMPGLKPEDIDISLENGVLWVRGKKEETKEDKERKIYRSSQRQYSFQITLPERIDERTEPKAKTNHGVVEITIPKAQPNQGKKIKVEGN